MTKKLNLSTLADTFRRAVQDGQSGAAEYADWLRAYTEQAASVHRANMAESQRVNHAINDRNAEFAWLKQEARALEGADRHIGSCSGIADGGTPIIYTRDAHDGRVAEWRDRLSKYEGRDCSDEEPRHHWDCVQPPEREEARMQPTPKPAPGSYEAELTAAVTAMASAS